MQILSDLFNLYYSKMNYFKNNKHIFKDKNIYAYSIIGTAISYFILNKVYNYFFKTNSKSKNIIKMSIASNRLKRLFNYEKCFININAKSNKELNQLIINKINDLNISIINNKFKNNNTTLKDKCDIKYDKLIEYTNNIVSKHMTLQEVKSIKENPQKKQDYIFYQILNGMKKRFDCSLSKKETNCFNKNCEFKATRESKEAAEKSPCNNDSNSNYNEIDEEKIRIMKEYSKIHYYNIQKKKMLIKENNNNKEATAFINRNKSNERFKETLICN